jgi:hypothetical protein
VSLVSLDWYHSIEQNVREIHLVRVVRGSGMQACLEIRSLSRNGRG